jgi:hypothetical protein
MQATPETKMSRNISTGWDDEVNMFVEMGFTAAQAHDALKVCGGNVDDAYDFLCSKTGAVSSSHIETQTAAKSFSSVKATGQSDARAVRTPRPPQSNTRPAGTTVPVGGGAYYDIADAVFLSLSCLSSLLGQD